MYSFVKYDGTRTHDLLTAGALTNCSYIITSESHGILFFLEQIILFPPIRSGTYLRLFLPRRLILILLYCPTRNVLSHVKVDTDGTRTHDNLTASQVFFQLNYWPNLTYGYSDYRTTSIRPDWIG